MQCYQPRRSACSPVYTSRLNELPLHAFVYRIPLHRRTVCDVKITQVPTPGPTSIRHLAVDIIYIDCSDNFTTMCFRLTDPSLAPVNGKHVWPAIRHHPLVSAKFNSYAAYRVYYLSEVRANEAWLRNLGLLDGVAELSESDEESDSDTDIDDDVQVRLASDIDLVREAKRAARRNSGRVVLNTRGIISDHAPSVRTRCVNILKRAVKDVVAATQPLRKRRRLD